MTLETAIIIGAVIIGASICIGALYINRAIQISFHAVCIRLDKFLTTKAEKSDIEPDGGVSK